MGHQRGQSGLVLQCGNAVKLRLKDSDALFVDAVFINASSVVIADLLLVGRALAGLGGIFQNAAEHGAVPLRQLSKAAPDGVVCRNWIVLDPSTTGELVKVHAGINALVQGGNHGILSCLALLGS